MIVIKIPAVLVLLRCCVFEAGVLLDTRMVTTGPRESTVSVSARTLITVTLLSFSVWLSLKQTFLPPARATSIVIVTTANQTQRCRGGSGARKIVFTTGHLELERVEHEAVAGWFLFVDFKIGFAPVCQTFRWRERRANTTAEGPPLIVCAAAPFMPFVKVLHARTGHDRILQHLPSCVP